MILGAALIAFASSAHAIDVFEVKLVIDKPNRLVFPTPFTKVIIQDGGMNTIEAIKLGEGRSIMLRPKKGAKDEIPVTFELLNGDVVTVLTTFVDKGPVTVWRYQGAPDSDNANSSALYGELSDKHGWIKMAFTAAHLHYYNRPYKMPGMTPVLEQNDIRLIIEGADKKSFITLKAAGEWTGMKRKLSIYQVISKDSYEIETYDFYRDGVVAVSLESDFVSPEHSPYVIILSEVK